jgi:hypothetical protein
MSNVLFAFPPGVRRTSVLQSKTLAQAEFTSAEHVQSKGLPKVVRLLGIWQKEDAESWYRAGAY